MTVQRRFKSRIRAFAPTVIDRIQIALGKKDKTYGGEFSALSQILDSLKISEVVEFVDIGAGDGFNMSIAFPISRSFATRGLLIEPNIKQLEFARRIYKNKDFSFCSEFLDPGNISDILKKFGFLNPTYVKIDIDSFDLDLLRGILLSNILPKIFSIEINELIPPPYKFEVKYTGEILPYASPLFGCSLQSVVDLATEMNYSLVSLAFNNAFFVHNNSMGGALKSYNSNSRLLYESGFLNRNWRELFPWNIKYEHWLTASVTQLDSLVKQQEGFDRTRMIVSCSN